MFKRGQAFTGAHLKMDLLRPPRRKPGLPRRRAPPLVQDGPALAHRRAVRALAGLRRGERAGRPINAKAASLSTDLRPRSPEGSSRRGRCPSAGEREQKPAKGAIGAGGTAPRFYYHSHSRPTA
jgi:hypothetical protein